MTINFNWLQMEDEFNLEKKHLDSEDVFSVEILEQEGCRPQAIVKLLNHADLSQRLQQKHLCIITKDKDILFKGILSNSLPTQLDENIITLTFETYNSTEKAQLKDISRFLRQSYSYDPLFFGDSLDIPFVDLLETSSQLLYWDRITGKIQLCDLFKGGKVLSLENNDLIFEHPFSMRYSHAPLKSIEIELVAKWVQTRQGYVDITPFIESKFIANRINTLSGVSLAKSWWQEGSPVSSTKYWIAASDLQEISGAVSKENKRYPRLYKIQTPQKKTPHILKRYWYKADLILGWNYLQPRKEIATIKLDNAHQLASSGKGKIRKIKINLCNLGGSSKYPVWKKKHRYTRDLVIQQDGKHFKCLQTHISSIVNFEQDYLKWEKIKAGSPLLNELSTASFFETDRGRQVINAALDLASAHLGNSSRCMEIRFDVPFEIAQNLTCHHTIKLNIPHLNNKKVQGKVKKLKLIASGEKNSMWGEVTLGISIGLLSCEISPIISWEDKNILLDYVEEGYLSSGEMYQKTSTNISYSITHKHKIQGLGTTSSVIAEDILEEIRVFNTAEDQLKILKECQGDEADLLKLLRKNLTDINIHLKPLEVKGTLARSFEIKGTVNYNAPTQIKI